MHTLAGGVIDCIDDRRRDADDADFAQPLDAERIDDVVRLVDEDHFDVVHVGVHWDMIFGNVRIHDAAEFVIDQLWSAIEALPDPEPQPDPKRPSKQDVVIAMLRQPEGATVDEVASVTGWQRHTVRGVFSGTLKKKLGLTLASAKEERGRVYRIGAPANL